MQKSEIIDKLRTRRGELKITQSELAESVGTFKGDISRIEAGKKDITLARLLDICEALGLNLAIL